MRERMDMIEPSDQLSVRRQAEVLEINRSSLYYRPVGESEENLQLMAEMDKLYTEDPTLGVIGMQDG
ncbi:MAG: hypothetical protein U5K79_17865 [Cyclobacteriaceae bacterium]|nr:hypothetical protein [Cyclobacteriaceae bacterium]